MRRALREARKGHPSPNPHVGAVVARGAELISVGHHPRRGAAHAEVMALGRAGDRARGGTLYVTLAPCNHQGLTGPCVAAIIAAGVARVVVACPDPTGHADGGTQAMVAAGIEVVDGERIDAGLRAEAELVLAPFAKHANRGLPWVVLKAAATLDGHMATRSGDSKWITGLPARKEAHRLRSRVDAVLVGVGTAIADDPALTVRHVRGRNPLRVVLDSQLRTRGESQLVRTAGQVETLIIHGSGAAQAHPRRAARLAAQGAQLLGVRTDSKGRVSVKAALRALAKRGVLSVLAEGGPQVHGALWDAGLVDQVELFVAPKLLGDGQAPPIVAGGLRRTMADARALETPSVRRLGDDLWIRGRVRNTQR